MADDQHTNPSTIDPPLPPELIQAKGVAEVFRAVEQVRADAHIQELEFNDKANERQFAAAKEQRESQERWFSQMNQRWWAVYSFGALIGVAVLLFAAWLISSDEPQKATHGWDILKIFGAFIVGFVGGWGYKSSKPK